MLCVVCREILVTTAFILLFVGLSFRSILVPVRAVLTIGLTIAFVFGLATLTYVVQCCVYTPLYNPVQLSSHALLWLCMLSQHGIFAWIPLPAFQKVGAVLWIVPILAFSLCVGIGLEYVSCTTTLAAVARLVRMGRSHT